MNEEINLQKALEKVEEYIKKVDELLKKSYKEGWDEKQQIITIIQGFIRATFKDDDKKIFDLKKAMPLYIAVGGKEDTEEEKQDYYTSHLKRIKNNLLAFKEEIRLNIDSKKVSEQIDSIEEKTKEVKAEVERRSAVADEKRWGAIIELIQMQRDELKRKGLLNQEIIEIKKDIADIKTLLQELKNTIG